MVNKTYPLLCGGTFFNVILKALKPKSTASQHWDGVNDGLDNQSVLIALTNIFAKGYVLSKSASFKTQTSEFRNCKKAVGTNLPFDDAALVSNFDEQVKNNYNIPLAITTDFAMRFLKNEKHQWLVKALLDFVRIDGSIKAADKFYCIENGIAIAKSELIKSTTVCLPALLLGIWHYIIMNRSDNKPGDVGLDLKNLGKAVGWEIEITMPELNESAPPLSDSEVLTEQLPEPDDVYEVQDDNADHKKANEKIPLNTATQILYNGTPITVIANQGGVGIGVNTAPITINNKYD